MPFLAGEYVILLLAQSFVYAIAAISLDLVWGYTGIPEMGHSLWFGIGALCVGSLTTSVSESGAVLATGGDASTFLLATAIGVAIATTAAAVAWYSFSRNATHFYIAVVGLALAAAAQPAYSQFPRYTGGEGGFFGFGYDSFSNTAWYYICAAILLCVGCCSVALVRSDFGLVLRAVRDNEMRLRYLGFNVEKIKIAIYSFGAGLAALAGAIFASMEGAVSAPLFGSLFATEMLVWVAVGGRGTILGPAVGTIALTLVGSKLSAAFPLQWSLFLGLAFVFVVVFFRHGLLPPLASWFTQAFFGRSNGGGQARSLTAGSAISFPTQKSGSDRDQRPRLSYGGLRVLRGVNLVGAQGRTLVHCRSEWRGQVDADRSSGGRRALLPRKRCLQPRRRRRHRGARPDAIARRGVVRKFQVPSLFQSLTVAEHILLATANGRWPSFWRRTRAIHAPPVIEAICAASGLGAASTKPREFFRTALRKELEMAMAVATGPQIVFMDEPTAGLSAVERSVVGDVLGTLTKSEITVILVEHDLDFVQRIADRIAVLHDGSVLEVGPPSQIARSEIVKNAYVGSFDLEQGNG